MFTTTPSTTPITTHKTTKTTRKRNSRVVVVTKSFWKKEAPPPPPPPPAKKKGLFGNLGKPSGNVSPAKGKTNNVKDVEYAYEETKTEAYARIRKQRALKKAEFEAREKGGISQALFKVTRALDFQEDIAADRGLLSAAKRMRKGESMSTEQYGALRRKVGGTKGGFFGESVDVKGEYTDSGWTKRDEDTTTSDVAYAPLLGLVLAGVVATLVLVVQQVP